MMQTVILVVVTSRHLCSRLYFRCFRLNFMLSANADITPH